MPPCYFALVCGINRGGLPALFGESMMNVQESSTFKSLEKQLEELFELDRSDLDFGCIAL